MSSRITEKLKSWAVYNAIYGTTQSDISGVKVFRRRILLNKKCGFAWKATNCYTDKGTKIAEHSNTRRITGCK